MFLEELTDQLAMSNAIVAAIPRGMDRAMKRWDRAASCFRASHSRDALSWLPTRHTNLHLPSIPYHPTLMDEIFDAKAGNDDVALNMG